MGGSNLIWDLVDSDDPRSGMVSMEEFLTRTIFGETNSKCSGMDIPTRHEVMFHGDVPWLDLRPIVLAVG